MRIFIHKIKSMYFDETNKQWISVSSDLKFGEKLKEEILDQGKNEIPAGTVMVFAWSGKPYMMFQTLQNIPLVSTVKDTTFVAYEAGSIVFLGAKGEFIPTIRFRYCRFPTVIELRQYARRATI